MFLFLVSSFLSCTCSSASSSASCSSLIGVFLSTTDGSCVISGRELERRRLGGGTNRVSSLSGDCALFPALLGVLVGEACCTESFWNIKSRFKLAGAMLPSGWTTIACWRLCKIAGSLTIRGCCLLPAAAATAMLCGDIIWRY